MNTMKKLFLVAGLLAVSSTGFAVPVKISNDNALGIPLTAHFSRADIGGKMSEEVNAGAVETVEFDAGELTITWKKADGTVVDTDVMEIAASSSALESSADDDQGDGQADKLS